MMDDESGESMELMEEVRLSICFIAIDHVYLL